MTALTPTAADIAGDRTLRLLPRVATVTGAGPRDSAAAIANRLPVVASLVVAAAALTVLPLPGAAVVAGVCALFTALTPAAGAGALVPNRRPALRAATTLALACWAATGTAGTSARTSLAVFVSLGLSLAVRELLAASRRAPGRVLLVGRPEDVAGTRRQLEETGGSRWEVVGTCAPPDCHEPSGRTVAAMVEELSVDLVLAIPCAQLDPGTLRRLAWAVEPTSGTFCVGTGMVDVAPTRTLFSQVGALQVVQVHPARRNRAAARTKLVAERLLAASALVVLGPVLLALVLAVRLDTPGPAFFRQVRIGRDGLPFTMLKLRTMRTDAEALVTSLAARNEASDGVLFKIRRDPRVTRVGRFLRTWSLDELPQLWNVVRGEMSLVGPRPALPHEVERYEHDPRRRLVVRPGLTGLWQVSGRSDLSWDETVRLDLRYVDNWSLGLDVAILFRTVGAVLGHRGAY